MEKKLSVYISELLLHFDCVVVPEFGGIVSNYRSSYIHNNGNSLVAASKSLAFNQNLNHQDGLLANYIAGAEKLSYEDANNFIRTEVAQWNKTIQYFKTLRLEEIGTFEVSNDLLQFKPDEKVNYLLESYGLSTVGLRAQSRTSTSTQINNTSSVKEEPIIISISKNKILRNVGIAASILLIALVGVLIQSNNKNLNKTIDASASIIDSPETMGLESSVFVPLKELSNLFNPTLKPVEVEIKASANNVSNKNAVIQSNKKSLAAKIEKTKSIAAVKNENAEIAIEPKAKNSVQHFQIVAGVYNTYEEAESMLNNLNITGFEAKLLPVANKQKYRVIIGDYYNKENASADLAQAKQINSNFYLLTL